MIDGNTRGRSTTSELDGEASPELLLDETALRQYRKRIEHLEGEIEEARSFNDFERESQSQVELDFLIEELRTSTGLGGRSRTATNSAERARVRVTKSLRTAIARITDVSPTIGNHLRNSVQTGTYCVYQPDGLNPIEWDVSAIEEPLAN